MILAFHGCPGLPEDFDLLAQELKRSSSQVLLKAIARKGYPGSQSLASSLPPSSLYLGYSFGCADAVEAASLDPQTKGIILIAPYLYPTKEAGAGMKVLLAIPGLSDLLLSLLGKKATKEFVVKTAHPNQAPDTYVKTGERYAKPAILKRAMTETSGRGPGITAALETLKKRNVPVLLVWGKQDQVCPESSQFEPLRELFPHVRERSLDQAGHALLWTHPEILSKEIIQFSQALA
ncbi:MAG: alpha/beta hydrolase [Bdellovibrionia bacterium]